MVRYKFFLTMFFCSMAVFMFGQRSATNKKNNTRKTISPEERYQKRITKEYLDKVYIPKDLSDAFVQFNKLIEKPTQDKFKSVPEKVAIDKLYFSFGKWISYNYGFRDGSRFSVYLNGIGLYHPEDMVKFVMTTYHRNLNKAKLDVKPLLEGLIANREKIKEERKLQGELISSEKRKVEVHPDSLKQN